MRIFSITGSGIEKFVIPGSREFVSGLGLQISRYFSICYRFLLCVGCSIRTLSNGF